MKFDVIGSNPIIYKQEDGRYGVIYAEPPAWKIQEYSDLTRKEVASLPFVNELMLDHLK